MSPTTPLLPWEAEDWAHLLGHLEGWLLHASDETLDELAEHLADVGGRRAIGDLGRIVGRLNQLAAWDEAGL